MKFKAAAGPWLSGRRRWSLRCLCFSVSSLLALFSLFVVSTSCQSVPDESPSIATPSNPTAVETTSLDPNAADHRPHGAHRQRRNQRFMLTVAAVAAFAVLAKLFSNVINRRTTLPAPAEGMLLVKQGGRIVEMQQSDFLRALKYGKDLVQLTKDEMAQIESACIKQLEEEGRLFFVEFEGSLEPFINLSPLEVELLDKSDIMTVLNLVLDHASREEIEHAIKLKTGEILRIKQGDNIYDVDRVEFLAEFEGHFAQIAEEFDLFEPELVDKLQALGRLIFVEEDGDFAPFLYVTQEEFDLINQREEEGESFVDLIRELAEL